MNQPNTDWIAYKHIKAAMLQQQGYEVRGGAARDHWLNVGAAGATPDHFYHANVQFYQEPSRYGIDDGKVSRLWIARYEVPTWIDVFHSNRPGHSVVYNFDRGEDVDSLKQHSKAKELYQALIELLN